jgi:hypothetical protein
MESNHGLLLGPIVGHTDTTTSRIWVRVQDEPRSWRLEVDGHSFEFVATDSVANEFGTAIAVARGLAPDTPYSYDVTRAGRIAATGSFRTMPLNGAEAEVSFVSLSCNQGQETGAWDLLDAHLTSHHGRFLLMMGDQVYMDEGENVWQSHLRSEAPVRRAAMAAKYQAAWSRQPLASMLANVPTYMTWDDHDVRNGWGSFAPDSPTLAAHWPRGAAVAALHQRFFGDARDVYYHFQACRNPSSLPGPSDEARPFAFRCGPLLVVVLDLRSKRDFARPSLPVLGEKQWSYIDTLLGDVDDDVEAIAIVTSVPRVDLDPDNKVHRLFRDRKDDIRLMRRGDERGLAGLRLKKNNPLLLAISGALGVTIDRRFRIGRWLGIGAAEIDGARDRWSYFSNRPEQVRLLRLGASAATRARPESQPRSLLFLSGDIHIGARLEISYDAGRLVAESVVSSGISQKLEFPKIVGVVVDREFAAAEGIEVQLKDVLEGYNFAVTRLDRSSGITKLVTDLKGTDAD